MARMALATPLLLLPAFVVSQNEGDPIVNWLLKDIDVYTSRQPLTELQEKLAAFQTEFTDESSTWEGECLSSSRAQMVIDNAAIYGFWDNSTIRTNYSTPHYMYEILAYAGAPVSSVPLFETSYEMVSRFEYNATYLDLIYHTTHASLTDGFYQWTVSCQDGVLFLRHRKVARVNPNTAKILLATVPKLDDNADDFTQFLANNNAASTENHVDNLKMIINEGVNPCDIDYNCGWWQGFGPCNHPQGHCF